MNMEWFKEMEAKEKILVIGGGVLAGYFLFRSLFSSKAETEPVEAVSRDVAGALTDIVDENTQFQTQLVQANTDFQNSFIQSQQGAMREIADLITKLSTDPNPSIITGTGGKTTTNNQQPQVIYVQQPAPTITNADRGSKDNFVPGTFDNAAAMNKAKKAGVAESMLDLGTKAKEIYKQSGSWSDPRITALHEVQLINANKAGLTYDDNTGSYH